MRRAKGSSSEGGYDRLLVSLPSRMRATVLWHIWSICAICRRLKCSTSKRCLTWLILDGFMEPPFFARIGKSLPGGADPVHLVLYHALSVSMGRKRPRANAHEPDLVLYHVFLLRRYADNKLHVWVFRGYLVLYHLPSLPPGLHIGVAPLEVTRVLFYPGLLCLFLPRLPALGTAARFLPVLDPAIRRKVLPTEKAPLDHRIP